MKNFSHFYKQTIEEQILAVHDEIASKPSNDLLRIYLAQLHMVQGAWKKSLIHLQVAAKLKAENILMAQAYREAIQCEINREQIFLGKTEPLLLDTAPQWLMNLTLALQLDAEKKHTQAAKQRLNALNEASEFKCTINEQEFNWLSDADPRLGPVCELFINGKYFWHPFSQIRKIKIEKPHDIRDLIWSPAQVTLSNGESYPALIPSRYPFSYNYNVTAAKCLVTEWYESDEEQWFAIGQKLIITEKNEYPLLEINQISILGEDEKQ